MNKGSYVIRSVPFIRDLFLIVQPDDWKMDGYLQSFVVDSLKIKV